jgi:hypothetical protein
MEREGYWTKAERDETASGPSASLHVVINMSHRHELEGFSE